MRTLPRTLVGAGALGLVLCAPPLVRGQAPERADLGPVGPAALAPSSVIERDAEGRVTLRANRLSDDLTIDGRLDEEVYLNVPPAGDFIQQLPREGEPATEQTEVWIFFDDQNIYIAARNWDSHPERIRLSDRGESHLRRQAHPPDALLTDNARQPRILGTRPTPDGTSPVGAQQVIHDDESSWTA